MAVSTFQPLNFPTFQLFNFCLSVFPTLKPFTLSAFKLSDFPTFPSFSLSAFQRFIFLRRPRRLRCRQRWGKKICSALRRLCSPCRLPQVHHTQHKNVILFAPSALSVPKIRHTIYNTKNVTLRWGGGVVYVPLATSAPHTILKNVISYCSVLAFCAAYLHKKNLHALLRVEVSLSPYQPFRLLSFQLSPYQPLSFPTFQLFRLSVFQPFSELFFFAVLAVCAAYLHKKKPPRAIARGGFNFSAFKLSDFSAFQFLPFSLSDFKAFHLISL